MSKAPDQCRYCDGNGNSKAGGECGFCEKGKPLDTQEDWDRTWGRVFDIMKSRAVLCGCDCHSLGRDQDDPCGRCNHAHELIEAERQKDE